MGYIYKKYGRHSVRQAVNRTYRLAAETGCICIGQTLQVIDRNGGREPGYSIEYATMHSFVLLQA